MKLARKTEFTAEARKAIHKRDNETCVFCAAGYELPEDLAYCQTALQIMHIVPRSQLGMGVEQNGALGCVWHHQMLDNGNRENRKDMLTMLEDRMRRIYPGWTREQVIYKKNQESIEMKSWDSPEREIQNGSRTALPEGFIILKTEEEEGCYQ